MFSPASASAVVQVLRLLEEKEHQRQARQCQARPYHVGKQVREPARDIRSGTVGVVSRHVYSREYRVCLFMFLVQLKVPNDAPSCKPNRVGIPKSSVAL